MLTQEQAAKIQKISDKYIDDELKRINSEPGGPERFQRLLREHPNRLGEWKAERFNFWVAFAEKVLDKGECYQQFRRGAFHTSNKIYRKIFTAITNISLPNTYNGTCWLITEYIGENLVNELDQAKREAYENDMKLKEEQKKADENKRMQAPIEAIKVNGNVDGNILVDVAKYLGVDVSPATAGMIRKRVRHLNDHAAQVVGRGSVQSAFNLYKACQNKINNP